jgi:hypothetical protein
MADFRTVHCEMWRADEWYQRLPTDARLLWIYLFTNPSASVAGIYRLPLRTMAFEVGLPEDRVAELLDMFAQDGKAYFENGVVWVRKMRERQLPGKISPQLAAHIQKEIDRIPVSILKNRYLEAYGYSIDTVSIPRATDTDTDTHTVTDTDTVTDTRHAAPAADRNEGLMPEQRAIHNAYDACGIVMSKTHQDAHLETIQRYGLQAWQTGFAAALTAGKHNVPAYVRRCAETAHIAETRGGQHATSRGNGHGTTQGFGLRRDPRELPDPEPTDAQRAEFYAASPA